MLRVRSFARRIGFAGLVLAVSTSVQAACVDGTGGAHRAPIEILKPAVRISGVQDDAETRLIDVTLTNDYKRVRDWLR
jgi:hypothetical protein